MVSVSIEVNLYIIYISLYIYVWTGGAVVKKFRETSAAIKTCYLQCRDDFVMFKKGTANPTSLNELTCLR